MININEFLKGSLISNNFNDYDVELICKGKTVSKANINFSTVTGYEKLTTTIINQPIYKKFIKLINYIIDNLNPSNATYFSIIYFKDTEYKEEIQIGYSLNKIKNTNDLCDVLVLKRLDKKVFMYTCREAEDFYNSQSYELINENLNKIIKFIKNDLHI